MRKAVTSSALMRPVVRPRLSSRVREPRVEDCFLDSSYSVVPDEIEVWLVARLSTEAFVLAGTDEMEDLVVVGVEPDVADCGVAISLLELPRLCCVSRLSLSRLGRPPAEPVPFGALMLTTLIPWPVKPLAGMNCVVDPSLRLRSVRSGWKLEQQSAPSLDVEYQWRASPRDS